MCQIKNKTMKFKVENAQVKDHFYLTIIEGEYEHNQSTKTYYLEKSECRQLIHALDSNI